MRAKYIFNNHYYVITNHAVAANPLFQKSCYAKRFLKKIDLYLSPLCEIIAYHFSDHEFQLVVKMANRKIFEDYYVKDRKDNGRTYEKIPHSTYIFSNAMAKLQSSLVAHFNWKEKRTGALFARRFRKFLIGSQEILNQCLANIKEQKKIHIYGKRWRHKVKGFRRKVAKGKIKWFRNSEVFGSEKVNEDKRLKVLGMGYKLGFQGRFINPPPKSISKKDLRLFLEIKHQIRIL